MSTTRFILAVLLCASPAMLLWDSLIAQGLVAEVIAITLVITARALRPGETGFLISIIRLPLAFAAIPALWIGIQALPLGLLQHPIWKSAETALAHPLAGTISVDPGTTIIALGQYLSVIAVGFLAAAVAVDRQRAEWVLVALIIATTAIAMVLLTHDLFFSPPWLAICAHEQAVDCAAMGTIIATAACVRSIEHYEMRQTRQKSAFEWTFIAPCAALVICGASLLFSSSLPMLLATAYGLFAFICVLLIRRRDLGWLGGTGLVVAAVGVATLLLAAHPSEPGTSVLLSFAASPPPLKSISEHVLDDARSVGTGARTFAALAAAYREINDPQPNCSAATGVATVAIELGRPMLWLIIVATLGAVVMLLASSLRRGRDWFYPAMGGGCLLALLLTSFTNAGLLGTTTGMLTAAALGLAFAQSKSRSAKQ